MIVGKGNLKILIVCWDNLGDVVLATPLIKKWRKSYPTAGLAVLVKSYTEDLLKSNPAVDELIVDTPFWAKDYAGLERGWLNYWRLIKKLRQKKFDLAIITNADWRKSLLIWLAGIPHRLGHSRKKSKLFLTTALYSKEKGKHIVQYHWELSPKSESAVTEEPEIVLDKEVEHWAKNFWRIKKTFPQTVILGIHPFAGNVLRCWPIENLVELINELIKLRWEILMFYHRQEQELVKKFKTKLLASVTWIGNIPFSRTLALIQSCHLFLGNDSGLLHCAAALGVPVAGIYGPSDWQRSAPWGKNTKIIRKDLECSPCGSDPKCQDLKCLKAISPDEVKKLLFQQLESSKMDRVRLNK